jgi:hypothetical protein
MQNSFEVLVTYADYRQGFVAELWLANQHVAEIYQDAQGKKCIDLHCPRAQALSLPLDAWLEALQQAQAALWPLAGTA